MPPYSRAFISRSCCCSSALIFRAVAIEFRSKQPMRWWRQMWDIGFAGGSILSSFLIGVAMGNIAWGVPLDAQGRIRRHVLDVTAIRTRCCLGSPRWRCS
ncbi:MAG: cytochrome d ubiquinol oxidase subunit II [Verrucomicrobiota bacterium]